MAVKPRNASGSQIPGYLPSPSQIARAKSLIRQEWLTKPPTDNEERHPYALRRHRCVLPGGRG